MKNKEEQYTLITGASTGLGKEMAIECAKRGMNLILVALSFSSLKLTSDAIEKEYKVKIIILEADLSTDEGIDRVINLVQGNFKVNFLINNAGVGGTSNIINTPIDFIDKIIKVNVRAMALITSQLLPVLLENDNSYIINVSSMAAFSPIAYKTVYPASKAFVYSFSRALQEELRDQNVNVTVVHPGPIVTNYSTTRRILAQGIKAQLGVVSAKNIAVEAINGVFIGKEVIIPGLWNVLSHWLMTIIPTSTKIRLASNIIRKEVKQLALS
jgi:uncharacterized protein